MKLIGNKEYKYLDNESLEAYLQEEGITLRYDLTNKTFEIHSEKLAKRYGTEGLQFDLLVVVIKDRLQIYLKHCTKQNISKLLKQIAHKDSYFNKLVYFKM